MTVGELMQAIEGYDENCEVRLMIQPSYPFECSVSNVASSEEIEFGPARDDGSFRPRNEDDDDEKLPVVYIMQGSQLGYGKAF